MDLIRDVLVNLTTSTVVIGALAFIFKGFIEKWLDAEFKKRDVINQHILEKQIKKANELLEIQMGVYPEILELVYRLRNIVRDGLNADMAYLWNEELNTLYFHLSENLYKYRLFLPDSIFISLHEFKDICKEAVILRNNFTKHDELFNRDDFQTAAKSFQSKFDRLNKLYEEITKSIQRNLNWNINDK